MKLKPFVPNLGLALPGIPAFGKDTKALAEFLGVKLSKLSNSYRGLCPIHEESTPSFFIYRDKEVDKGFYCFGCGVGGDSVELLYHWLLKWAKKNGIEGNGITRYSALRLLFHDMTPLQQALSNSQKYETRALNSVWFYYSRINKLLFKANFPESLWLQFARRADNLVSQQDPTELIRLLQDVNDEIIRTTSTQSGTR